MIKYLTLHPGKILIPLVQHIELVLITLATASLFAGIRLAVVSTIGIGTIASAINAGGLGDLIFTGLGLNRMDLLVLGGVSVAILSLGCGLIFDLITRRV